MVAFRLAKEMKRLGHRLCVITTTRERKKAGVENLEGIKVYRIYADYHPRWRSYLSLHNFRIISQIEKIIKEFQPDISHFHNIHWYISYYSIKLAKKYSKKVFLTAHDAMIVHYGKWLPKEKNDYKITLFDQIKTAKKRYNPFRNLFIGYCLKSTDKIFAVSNSLKRLLVLNGVKNTAVIYNGINIRKWQKKEKAVGQFIKKHRLEDKKVILFAGRLNKARGGEVILKSLREILKKEPNTILLVIGKKDAYASLMVDLCKKYKLGDNVVFTGWITGQELKAAYWSSDLVVFPSLCFESFGLVCLEAMAAKKPVVASYFGGPSEIVLDKQSGYLVNPYNISQLSEKSLELLTNKQRKEEFGQVGFKRAKQLFTLEKQVDAYLKWYKGNYE